MRQNQLQNYEFFPGKAVLISRYFVLLSAKEASSHLKGSTKVDNFEKKYYKISEVADFVGLPASTLRFWESRFTIIKPRRNSTGTRSYTPADIEKIRMVAFLVKEKGLRLEAAEQQLVNNRTGVSRRSAAVERLHKVREQLQTLLDSLHSLR